jgi:hypothetical protein
MTLEARYVLAHARLAALAHVGAWSDQDLADVAALTTPCVAFDAWAQRVGAIQGKAPAALGATPEDPDPETTAAVSALLGASGRELEAQGILSVTEIRDPK